MSVIESLLSPEVVRIIGWTVVHSLWQGVAVALLLVIVLAAFRRRSANARYVAGCAALVLVAGAALLTAGLLSFHSGTGTMASNPVRTSASEAAFPVGSVATARPGAPDVHVFGPALRGRPKPMDSPPLPARTVWRVRASPFLEKILSWIVLGWLAGVIVLSMRLLGGWAQAERLTRCGTRPVTEVWRERLRGLASRLRVTRPVRLLESTLAQVPTAIGWLRPVILIPTGVLTGLRPDQVEVLLAHELAHIRRYDYLVNVVQTVIETLVFYHPAVWWISRRIRTEREYCCDDLAVAVCGDALVYARALATLEEQRQRPARLAVAASGGSLLDRVRRVVRRPGTRRSRVRYWLAGVVTLSAAALTGAVALRDSPPAIDPQVTALWERIRAANSAWLDPTPAAITVRAESLERDHFAQESERWQLRAEAEVMAAAGRNARFLRRLFAGNGEAIERELRYADGVGGQLTRVPSPPSQRDRKLRDPEWLAARIGVPLWTSMHQAAAKGLPPGTSADRQGDLIIVRIKATPVSASRDAFHAWNEWRSFGPPDYGLATSSHDITVTPTAIEWELDAATLRPQRLLEHSAGSEVVVEFGKQWLPCGSGVVPQRVVVRDAWPQGRRIEITYEMQSVDSAWVVKQASKRHWEGGEEIESLAERVETREVSLAPIDPAWFKLPTDVELPAHSYTELKPGERIVTFRTADGLTLEGKLSLPPNATGPVPVAMLLAGSGPWTFDRPVRIPNPNEMFESVQIDYLDLYAKELTARGLGFFSVNKRGCAQIKEPPHAIVRRAVFSKTTPSVLLDDYAAALVALRSESGVAADRIVLMGISEGTVLAPRLAHRSPAGVTGLVLASYAGDNTHDTIVWQCTVGPWRNMARVYDLDGDDRITREEWDKATPDTLFKMRLGSASFEQCDHDRNGVLEPKDLAAANAPRLEAILKAVKEVDDEWLWWNLVKLNTAHLRAEWHRPPLHEELLRLNVPIHIVHGMHDGAVRVEGVRAAEAAFRRAGRTNLVTHILPRVDHDLNYGEYLDTYFAGRPQTPAAMKVMFDAVAEVAAVRPGRETRTDSPGQQGPTGTERGTARYEPIPAEAGPTNDITGVVMDEEGKLVGDAPVLAMHGDADARREARTDAHGRFAFEKLEPEGLWLFSVNDSRFARQWERETYVQVPCERLDLPLRLSVHAPRALDGVVVNEQGEPVAGVAVTLAREWLPGREDPVQGWLAWDLQVTETDADGRFRLERLRPGKVALVLDHPGYARTVTDPADVTDAEAHVTIEKGLVLRGRVTHEGKPVGGVNVTINAINLSHRSLGHWQVHTDAKGEFAVEHVTGFSPDIVAIGSATVASVFIDDPVWNSPVYQVGQIDEHTLPFVELEARPGAADLNTREVKKVGDADPALRAELSELPSGESEIEVRLEPAPDESGSVPEVWLSRLAQEENEQLYLQESPGADGVVTFVRLPAGTYRVGTDNHTPPNYAPKYVGVGEGKRAEVVLRKGPAKLTGVIRSGGQRLNLRDLEHAISCELPSPDPRIGTTRYAGTLRDDGSYEIDGLAYGRYLVTVMLAGSWPYTLAIDTREPGAQRDIELPTGRITGKVVAELPPRPPEEGRPPDRVFVVPRDMLGSGSASAALDEQQEFRLEHVPEGTYVISFPVPGERDVTFDAVVQLKRPGDHVHAELQAPEQTGWIAGAIAFADADAAQALSDRDYLAVYALPKEESGYHFRGGRRAKVVERGDMSYRLTDVPPGTYAVSVMSFRSKVALTWIPDVEVRAGLVRKLDVTIPQGREVRILPGYQGKPPSTLFHWRLQMPTGDWIPYGLIVGSHGRGASAPRFSFVLPYGEYVVEADFGEDRRVRQPFTVEPGDGVQEIVVATP
jgi:beta-lactamase regulating signal transducer with metallopeptidase domain/pimeloyl-ACP methyl ester carboxylesterase